jgi:hypothetical protein
MLFMVVERFKDAPAIYQRLREKGRMMPEGLEYVSSWIDVDLKNLLATDAHRRRVAPPALDRQLERFDGLRNRPSSHVGRSARNDGSDLTGSARFQRTLRGILPRSPEAFGKMPNAARKMRALPFVQCDASAHPSLVDVEIDAHHFALTHSDEIVHERRIMIPIRPYKHHPDLSLRFVTVDRPHKRSVLDFPLQDPIVGILQRRDFFARWFHVHTVAGE